MKKDLVVSNEIIGQQIYLIRNQRVMLDADLANLYGVETKALNQAVQRNIERFPEDFAFKLSRKEWLNLRSQFVTSSLEYGGRRYLPYVFTEQGVAMLSSVLRSPQAVAVNIQIMRTFIQIRHSLSLTKELSKEMNEIKSFLLKTSNKTDREFKKVWQALDRLMDTSKNTNTKRQIGFKLN